MQLIVEAETNLEIKSNMCDLDQGLCDKEIFKDSTQNILRSEENSNSNKENINIQDNCAEESIIITNEKVIEEISQEEYNKSSINESKEIVSQDESTLDLEQSLEKNNDDKEIRLDCNEEPEKYTNNDTKHKKSFEEQNVEIRMRNANEEKCVEDNVCNSPLTSLVDQEVISVGKEKNDVKIVELPQQNEHTTKKEPEENLDFSESISSKLDICKESENVRSIEENHIFDDITAKQRLSNESEKIHQEHVDNECDVINKEVKGNLLGQLDRESEYFHREIEENKISSGSNITPKELLDNDTKNINQELKKNNVRNDITITQKGLPNNEDEKVNENETFSNAITPNDQLCNEEEGIYPINEKSGSPSQSDMVEEEGETCKDDDLLLNKMDTDKVFETTLESEVENHKPSSPETLNDVVTFNVEVDSAVDSIAPVKEYSKIETVVYESDDIKEASDSIAVDTEQVPTKIKEDDTQQIPTENKEYESQQTPTENKEEPMEVDDVSLVERATEEINESKQETINNIMPIHNSHNTLNIVSDDEDESFKQKTSNKIANPSEKQCINLDDDDDIMLVDVETNRETKTEKVENKTTDDVSDLKECYDKDVEKVPNKECVHTEVEKEEEKDAIEKSTNSENIDVQDTKSHSTKPFIPENFLNIAKKRFSDMTRAELEEFCVLKIVESIVDRSSLSDTRSKLKKIITNVDDYKKKIMMLTKQNRDLQVVLKSIQEEQKRANMPIAPLKITRSVGMQVYMADGPNRRKGLPANNPALNSANRMPRTPSKPQTPQKAPQAQVQQIPVPRLVPASNIAKSPIANVSNSANSSGKASPSQNAARNVQKQAEKRPLNKVQTVDLTDDEPPSKVASKNNPVPPVRVVPQQNLLGTRPQFAPTIGPRKVFIPINGPQSQTIKPGQTIVYKSIPGVRPRGQSVSQSMVRLQPNQVRMRVQALRHPAPLPDVQKQYQPPNWKALPPAPDLKLSKVENGIVISWKIDNYIEENFEDIASYQLYAYQENTSPPSTALWKKIGDVKALPLPMACTLTQFVAGYKYYFAVRAVDVKSRLGPFSLPGSILLLNKM